MPLKKSKCSFFSFHGQKMSGNFQKTYSGIWACKLTENGFHHGFFFGEFPQILKARKNGQKIKEKYLLRKRYRKRWAFKTQNTPSKPHVSWRSFIKSKKDPSVKISLFWSPKMWNLTKSWKLFLYDTSWL